MYTVCWISFGWSVCIWQACMANIPFWQMIADSSMTSTRIRTEEAATDRACQQLCEAAADAEGCRSVNFNGQTCDLLAGSALEADPVVVAGATVGTNFYEFCTMMLPGGKRMMTSSNGNIFRVIGHLCREFSGHRWIPHTQANDAELWCYLWSAPEKMVE